MTDSTQGRPSAGPTAAEPSPVKETLGRARDLAFDAGRASAPVIKRVGARLGDWLATVGWVKFFFVALLLLILGGIADSVFYDNEGAVVITRSPKEHVKVDINVGSDGVRIQAPEPPVAPEPPAAPEAGVPTAPLPPREPAAPKVRKPGDAGVKIDEKGVRIFSNADGKNVSVVVDEKGVRIERLPREAADAEDKDAEDAITIEADGRTITIPPEIAQDPIRLAKAVEGARDQIEQIVEDQINRQVAREVRRYRAKGGDWLMGFVTLLIVTGIIVKVVLGGKKRAEKRAQAATATAAEESLKRQLVEAQLKMMQAQVEPHFLFNTLASVDYLIETEPSTASKMQKNLIQYLRAALPQMREGSTTLGKEIQLCRSYLEILKFRMEDRLQYTMTVPQGLQSAQFPPMMLQSLVENSIKHGLEPKPEGGSITISADVVNGRLRVTVADTGLGFAAGGRPGTGVGLGNVRERLAALYGGAARLSIEANTPSGTIVTIEVPYTFEADAPETNSNPA
jgi:signal transduction histidine kinase